MNPLVCTRRLLSVVLVLLLLGSQWTGPASAACADRAGIGAGIGIEAGTTASGHVAHRDIATDHQAHDDHLAKSGTHGADATLSAAGMCAHCNMDQGCTDGVCVTLALTGWENLPDRPAPVHEMALIGKTNSRTPLRDPRPPRLRS